MRAQAAQATITHAVIGTEERIDFGISNDAAFFQILSSSLYKNPLLAVVRETMCNAHDAHIMGGVQKPIVIKFDYDESTISFRDFGPGIPHDLIGPIYGVYGASTKKADSRQTGAFGLGCKSPFAYVEHFEVTSWNQGVMSLYNMSRSSAAKDGTPGITRLLNLPTTETGLQVKFKILHSDIPRFRRYIECVAYLGGIPTQIEVSDGSSVSLLPMIPLVRIPEEWTLVNQNMLVNPEMGQILIYVRYGTVIYPVEPHSDYRQIYNIVGEFIRGHTSNQILLIEAIPDSLVVMPNRESLSMQEQTTASLKALLEGFFNRNLKEKFKQELITVGKDALNEAFTKHGKKSIMSWRKLLGRDHNTSSYDESYPKAVQLINGISPLTSIAQANVARVFQRETEFSKLLFKILTAYRGRLLQTSPELDRGFVQSYFRARLKRHEKAFRRVRAIPTTMRYDVDTAVLKHWYLDHVVGPVATRLHAENLGTKSNLLMYGQIPGENKVGRRYRQSRIGFGSVHAALHRTATNAALIIALERRVILTTGIKTLEANQATIFNTFFKGQDTHGLLAYVLPLKKEQQEKARKVFNDLGYDIIDLSVDSDWKTEPVKLLGPAPKPKKPAIEGRRTLLSYYRHGVLRKDSQEDETQERLTNPEFYAYLIRERITNETQIETLKRPHLSLVKSMALFGVGVETANSIPMLRNAGVPCMAEYLFTNLHNHMLSSQTFKQGFAYDLIGYVQSLDPDKEIPPICKIAQQIPELRDHFKLLDPMTDDDRLAWRWWKYLKTLTYHRLEPWKQLDESVRFLDGKHHTCLQEIDAFLKTLTYDDSLKVVWDLVETNPLLKFFDLSQIETRLLNKASALDQTVRKQLIEMLLTAINV